MIGRRIRTPARSRGAMTATRPTAPRARHATLQASERRAETQVRSAAERQVLARVRAPDVESVGSANTVGISVGGADAHEHVALGGDRRPRPTTASIVVRRRQWITDESKRSTSSTAPGTSDAIGAISAQLRESRAAGAGVAEEVGRRLVAGEQQPEQDRRDLLLRERLAAGVGRVHQVGGEVLTGIARADPRRALRSSARTSPCRWRSRPARPRSGARTSTAAASPSPASRSRRLRSARRGSGTRRARAAPRSSAETISARPSCRRSATNRRTRSRTNGSICRDSSGREREMRDAAGPRVRRRIDVRQRRHRAELRLRPARLLPRARWHERSQRVRRPRTSRTRAALAGNRVPRDDPVAEVRPTRRRAGSRGTSRSSGYGSARLEAFNGLNSTGAAYDPPPRPFSMQKRHFWPVCDTEAGSVVCLNRDWLG